MDQTHGMNHFHGDSGRHGLHAIVVGVKHFAGGQTEDRSDALAAGHQRVEHGLANLLGLGTVAVDAILKGFCDGAILLNNVGVQVKVRGGGSGADLDRGRRGGGGWNNTINGGSHKGARRCRGTGGDQGQDGGSSEEGHCIV